MKKPRSIERNLVSLGLSLGSLLVILVLSLFGVEHALGTRLERLGSSTMPAQKAVTGLRHAVSGLFQRQVQVLSTRSEAELEQLKDRAGIERGLTDSRQLLASTLPEIVGKETALREDGRLSERTREVLASDAALFDSVRARHSAESQFDSQAASSKIALDQLIQEARAVAGIAHLEYVLELRRVAAGAPADKVLHGKARSQQEAAEEVVTAVLQLGQLMGKIGLAKNEDELNSIVANELAQNLARARIQLKVLVANLEGGGVAADRAGHMQTRFDAMAAQISNATDAQSLVRLRRSILVEATRAADLRGRILSTVKGLSSQLESVERIVADETYSSTRSARRTLWFARALSVMALAAALGVGLRAARQLRDSVRGLRAQNQELESLSRDLKSMNEGLEGLVAERSAALIARERSMRLVLDAMSEGLVLAELDGKISGECSKAAVSWFGPAASGALIWDYLFAGDASQRDAFRVGFDQLAEDLMPFEGSADCMPRRLEVGGRMLSLGYRQVMEDGRFQRVLVVMSDITHQVESEARERDEREQHHLLAHLLKDKQDFQIFVRDTERLLSELSSAPARGAALRVLHTLKGNTAVFGMETVAARCHELEQELEDQPGSISERQVKDLRELWRSRLGRIEGFVANDAMLELGEGDFAELVAGLKSRRDYPVLLELVESWKWMRTSVLLRRLETHVYRVGERLGKELDVRIEHNGLRVMPAGLEEFWASLIHVVRNAVDHGIESSEDRLARGKPATGLITLRTARLEGGGFSVEFGDDGPGLDHARLRQIAEQRGLPRGTNQELVEVMFADGVTTRDEASEVSGRGVGLGAVVAACRAADGRVDVDSVPGKGTWFRFSFPKRAVLVRETSGKGSLRSVRPAPAAQTA